MDASSATNLIINYLPQTLTDEEFRSIFINIGPLKSSKIIRDRGTGYSYGFGFVEYQSVEDAQTAISSLNGLQLQNKRIKVAAARVGDNNKGANLYVRNIPRLMTSEAFEMMFSKYGTVVNSRILQEKTTGQSKGVGFVLFETKDMADTAIGHLHGQFPEGFSGNAEVLNITYADDNKGKAKQPSVGAVSGAHGDYAQNFPKYSASNMNMGGNQNFSPRGEMSGFYAERFNEGGSSYYDEYEGNNHFSPMRNNPRQGYGPIVRQNLNSNRYNPMFSRSTSAGPGESAQFQSSNVENEGFILFVYNIGPSANESELWNLFSPYGPVLKVNIIKDQSTKQGKGYGFVTMGAYHDCVAAIDSLNGSPYGKKNLQVSFKNNK